MNTYKYQFSASGKVDEQYTFTTTLLENKLKDGYDCLAAYGIFPSDSDILDHVSIDTNHNEITAINLHTYTELYEGMENDLKDCVQENLNAITEEHDLDITDAIKIGSDVRALGLQDNIPETLYRISQKKNLNSILENGLIPQQGKNGYKSHEDYVYLMEKCDIPAWMAVLPNLDDPVILEIDTTNLEGIEPGRHFTDRDFVMPNGYGEYRTKNVIPASNIKQIELTEEVKIELLTAMKEQLDRAKGNDRIEAARGIDRLSTMGIWLHDYPDLGTIKPKTEEGLPWDDKEQGDGLTKALGQMTLKDFGIDI